MQFLKKRFPVMLAFVMGIIMFGREFVPTKMSQGLYDGFVNWDLIITGFGAIFAIVSLLHYHVTRVRRKVVGFGFSILTLIAFAQMALLGIVFGMKFSVDSAAPAGWQYQYIFVPMQATMFATLAFFIASAAFRAFRARTWEALALLVAGLLVMIGRVPLGEWISPRLGSLAEWIMQNPNMAAQRGVFLGVALAGIAISVRIIFGIERTYMGGGD
jgi:hypothetical protein